MVDLLFGWLFKPKYLLTVFDGIICTVEIFTILFIICIILAIITEKKHKIRKD